MRNALRSQRISVVLAGLVSVVVLSTTPAAPGQDKNVPQISIGPSLKLGDVSDAGEVDLMISPTGAVAAFVPTRRWPGREGQLWMSYRVSTDGAGRGPGSWRRRCPIPRHR